MRLLFAVTFLVGAIGCAGRVIASGDGGSHNDSGGGGPEAATPDTGGPDVESAHEASFDAGVDCGQPNQTVYSCPHDSGADALLCHRYGGPHDNASADAGYPRGCSVTLPTCNLNFGVAQTCNCGPFPIGDGSPQWVCPL